MPEPTTQYDLMYPPDPRALPRIHANYVNIYGMNEELYLEFCSVEPQELPEAPEKLDGGAVRNVPTLVQLRVVIARAGAKRLYESLGRVLAKE